MSEVSLPETNQQNCLSSYICYEWLFDNQILLIARRNGLRVHELLIELGEERKVLKRLFMEIEFILTLLKKKRPITTPK